MKIQNKYDYYTNFKAIKVASTQNRVGKVVTNIDLYRITKEDKPFLEKLKKYIDFTKLVTKLDAYSIERWQHIFDYCVSSALEKPLYDSITYIAVSNNKPCGIINSHDFESTLYLNGICSIPVEQDKKVNLCGKTMFYQFFKDAKERQVKNVTLSAVNNGPFNVVDKYEKFGFTKDPTSYPYTKMICNKYKIEQALKDLPNDIKYRASEPVKTNLEQFLD